DIIVADNDSEAIGTAPVVQPAAVGLATVETTSTDPAIWNLVTRNRIGLAYQINWCVEHSTEHHISTLPGAIVLKALALSSLIHHSASDAVDLFTQGIDAAILDLGETVSHPFRVHEPSGLLIFAASLRPTLIAPSTRSSVLLDSLTLSDRYSHLDRVRES